MKKNSLRVALFVSIGIVSLVNLYVLTPTAYAWCGPNLPTQDCRTVAPSGEQPTLTLSDQLVLILQAAEHIFGR